MTARTQLALEHLVPKNRRTKTRYDKPPVAVARRKTCQETGLALFCRRVDSTAAAGVHGLPEEHEDIRVVVKTLAEVEALLDTVPSKAVTP